MSHAVISGTGSYLPENIVTNHQLEKLNTSDTWITERTGIKQRRLAAIEETASSMAELAARSALAQANLTSKDIDLIIVATCTPDMIFPSTACLLQKRLGARTIPAFDIQAACTGFVYALDIATNYIRSGAAQHVLVVGSEVMSRVVDWSDRRTCILFGDGAGAVILSASETAGILSIKLGSDGSSAKILNLPLSLPYQQAPMTISMIGSDVFKFAVGALGQMLKDEMAFIAESGLKLDWFIPHQANLRIIEAAAKKLGLSLEQVITTVDQHANTSSASIPLALDTAINDGRIQRGQILFLQAFGGGLTWGSAVLRY